MKQNTWYRRAASLLTAALSIFIMASCTRGMSAMVPDPTDILTQGPGAAAQLAADAAHSMINPAAF